MEKTGWEKNLDAEFQEKIDFNFYAKVMQYFYFVRFGTPFCVFIRSIGRWKNDFRERKIMINQ